MEPIEERYPELNEIANEITISTITRINGKVKNIESKMPYKAQAVLEMVISKLEKLV